MPDFTTPAWLLLLPPVVLLIRWLHHFRSRGELRWVPALFLWRGLPAISSQGQRQPHPDPAWRRRALLAALLLLLLAGPGWSGLERRQVTVWFDDSLSMQSREQGKQRLETAIGRLSGALRSAGVDEVTLRFLSPGGGTLGTGMSPGETEFRLRQWLETPRPETGWRLPPPPLPVGEQWLVTDGAGPGLQQWLREGGIDRVIQVGERGDNSALLRLSLRRRISHPGSAAGLVTLLNTGARAMERLLLLETDQGALQRLRLTLPAGAEISRRFQLPLAGIERLQARLAPPPGASPDPLPADDRLALRLPVTGWRYPVFVTAACGKALTAALESLPGLRRQASPRGAALTVACSAQPPALAGGALLWFHPPAEPRPLTAPLEWARPLETLAGAAPEADQLVSGHYPAPSDGEPLLKSDGHVLIAHQRQPVPRIEVRLDLSDPAQTRHPWYPLLVARLAGLALDDDLLDGVLEQGREAAASRIRGRPLEAAPGTNPPAARMRQRRELAGGLLLALALLLFDLFRTFTGPARAATGPAGQER
ncbi:MAG TPA: hypothetical protein ENK50_03340 [Sedimenticola sp.]|nr:hypothetical protein [Sedimenticola sp.]